jgi:short-subunit dehydrogenase
MNIIVTGASRGIGYELVKKLSQNKNHTLIATARNEANLLKLKAECDTLNNFSNVIIIPCKLEDEASLDNFINEIKNNVSEIAILINNAGALVNKPFAEINRNDLENIYNVNVFSVVTLIQQILPLLVKKTKAHIVNISSIGGFQGSQKFAGLSAYSSSKAALACLTECLAEEYKDTNITFNCLALGAVQTEMLENAFPGYKAPISAEDMATFISDFALNAPKYLNGKIIPVSLSNP